MFFVVPGEERFLTGFTRCPGFTRFGNGGREEWVCSKVSG
jgi:hypothetical protein